MGDGLGVGIGVGFEVVGLGVGIGIGVGVGIVVGLGVGAWLPNSHWFPYVPEGHAQTNVQSSGPSPLSESESS